MRQRILLLIATLTLLAACSSTSTPDLNVILILHCGSDDCEIHDDNRCEGRGRWNDFSNHGDIVVTDNMGDLIKREEMELGNYDDVNNTCMFSEMIDITSSASYGISVGDHRGTKVMKSTLEDQNWRQVLVFND